MSPGLIVVVLSGIVIKCPVLTVADCHGINIMSCYLHESRTKDHARSTVDILDVGMKE